MLNEINQLSLNICKPKDLKNVNYIIKTQIYEVPLEYRCEGIIQIIFEKVTKDFNIFDVISWLKYCFKNKNILIVDWDSTKEYDFMTIFDVKIFLKIEDIFEFARNNDHYLNSNFDLFLNFINLASSGFPKQRMEAETLLNIIFYSYLKKHIF